MLTVSMPTWRTPPDRFVAAVRSVLDQTHWDLTLVVVGDGEPVPPMPVDDRIVTFELDVNRGRYYADAVVAAACRTPWFTVHDADDTSDPDRYARMLQVDGEVIVGGEMVERTAGWAARSPQRFRPSSRMRHLWHASALYRTDTVVDLLHPGFRVGYDTLLCNLLGMTRRIGYDPTPSYHRAITPGSLTRHPDTAIGSTYRAGEVRRLQALYRHADRTVRRSTDPSAAVRRMIRTDIDPNLRAQVADDADRLRPHLYPTGRPAQVDARDVTVWMITGGRPALLDETLTTARRWAPGLLESAEVIVYLNGHDPDSDRILDRHADVIDRRLGRLPRAPNGIATTELLPYVTESGRPLALRLEDDWAVDPGDDGWLARSRRILDDRPAVSQVRLRQAIEPTLGRHQVTGRKIRWSDHPGWRWTPDAHLTFNPTLMRTADLDSLVTVGDARGEVVGQRSWHAAGHREMAQLVPGVFRHIGGRDSLRLREGIR